MRLLFALVAAAREYRETRIFWKTRIPEGKFTEKEGRSTIGLHPAQMDTTPAEPRVGTSLQYGFSTHELFLSG